MIHTLYLTKDGQLQTNLTADDLFRAAQDPDGLLWVFLVWEQLDRCEPILMYIFGFHPLGVDDALRQTHVPKVDDWGY